MFKWPYLHTETLQEIRAAAKERNLVLIVHANSVDSWQSALDTHADNAIALGLSHELGSIEVGKRADLLLLKENPLTNVSAYDWIETIFLNGKPIAREELRAHD